MRVGGCNHSQDGSKVGKGIFVSECFIGYEIINFLLDLFLEFREFVQAIEEKRVNVSQNSNDSN